MSNMNFKEMNAYYEEKNKRRIYCPYCNHSLSIIPKADYKVCSHCGHDVFNEKGKFKVKALKKIGVENIKKYLIRETETFKGRKKDVKERICR